MSGNAMQIVAMLATFGLGGLAIFAYLLLGRARGYLLYMGAAFCLLGVSLVVPNNVLRILFVLLALGSFIMAIVEVVSDIKERLRTLREKQQEREEAFADFLQEMAKAEDAKAAQTAPPQEEDGV